VRGAFANYYKLLVSDFKSIAASGWGPELIPDDDILQSQFPQVLAELEPSTPGWPSCRLVRRSQRRRTTKTPTTRACCLPMR
jgi:hypothetical protein